MFHRSEKAIRYAKELDEARLNGQFQLVPNLARKLLKHDHHKQCWAKSAVCEKTLHDHSLLLEKDHRNEVLKKDGPHELLLPPTTAPDHLKELIASMDDALKSSGTDDEKQLAEVIAGQLWMIMGQWRKVIDKTSRFAAGDDSFGNQGYAYVLILKAFAYHGMAHEGLDNFHIALDNYQRAHDYIQRFTPASKYHAIQHWIGVILYRMCMLSLRLQDPLEALENFRRYKRFADNNFGNHFGMRERLTIYYWYWRTLSNIIRSKVQERAGVAGANTEKDIKAKVEFYELKDELLEIQSQYESILTASTKFPRAGSTNMRVLEFADRAMENWRLLGSDFADAKNLVQILYRATAKTFQSPRIMRHLIYALEGAGNYTDAERSLDAYIFIMENEKKTIAKVRREPRDLDDEEIMPDVDSDEDILRTVTAGIRLLVKYLNNGSKAMDLIHNLERNVKAWKVTSPDVLASIYHAIGIANSLWSIQTIDPDSRVSIQLTAVTAYTTALTHAPNKLQTYYQLALQYARQRNIEKSLSALSQALHLDKTHIPSIHLLTLVLTSLEDYEKALQTCHTVKFGHIDDLPLDDAVALMELQLTYLRIVEAVSGRDLALEVQKGVFVLYNRLFGPVKANQGYVKAEADVDWEQRATMSEQSLRRTKSNIPERRHMYKSSQPSIESKLSLQVPVGRAGRTKSLLRRKQRSRSMDGSIQTRSSEDFSEKTRQTDSSEVLHPPVPPVPTAPESTVREPNRASTETKSSNVVQRLSNHASDLPSKFTSSPNKRREQVAKLYRAKLWLACAGIYRRGRQWEGAHAAIQDALLCDACPEEVFTELGYLHLEKESHFEATTNFERALLCSEDYPPAVIGLAKTLLTLPRDQNAESSRDRAEVLLDSVTKLGGWDNSEAWFWLGEIYERCNLPEKAAECWSYCEELEERKPIRDWSCVKPEWL